MSTHPGAYWKPPERAASPLPFNPHASAIPVTRATSGSARIPKAIVRASISQPSTDISSSPQKPSALAAQPVREAPPENSKICECCEATKQRIWNCVNCDMNFCDDCWGKQGPHKAGRTGPDGLPHEKGDPTIVKRLKNILTPPTDSIEQQQLHVEDEDTTWFGIARDEANHSIFQDYGRYANIMADSTTGAHKLRYPQLVSFIGQTGAGKSTLVKMLIDQQERRNRPHQSSFFASPVVGSVRTENVPTSGDVHLYGDPGTYLGEYPLLYADCEGLEGGENMPISAQYTNSTFMYKDEKKEKRQIHQDHRKRHKIAKVARGTPRNIKWASTPETSKRQYAVTELYPRLLYTFSDVIVFVLRNPKTFESSVLSKLIDWASTSMEKSLNQPTLPHAIIALNATDMEVDQQEWDPEYATNILLSSVSGAHNRDSKYRALADYWISRGKRIQTMSDLLECYYSSVTVVRIPIKGRYMKIDEQIKKLHKVLLGKCSESTRAKRKSRMLSNSEELNIYLQCAFDHFSQDLDTPFNFMDVAFRINPIPSDFGGNILKLAVAIKNSNRMTDPRNIFRELSFMVASCIMLDCSRQSLKGPAEQILAKAYIDYCDSALEDFCAIFWPCTFSNRLGRCVNVQDRHKKGHQNEKGKIIGTGEYTSDFTWETFADDWERLLQGHLSHFETNVQQQITYDTTISELVAITNLHHANVNIFYQRLGGAQTFISHSACFCCLREMAEHPLQCGHVLCTPCVKGYGKAHEGTAGLYTVATCPLHEADTAGQAPWEVHFKPPLAGVRILSLDGGGIRGIVILEVLLSIEKEFDHRIPILDFFDLVVGTSTGGILALALGVKNMPVKTCIALFRKLVGEAFTPKFYGGLKIGKRKYRTRPLENVLIENFKEDPIFGGVHETSASYTRKVAVTASCETGEQAVIFTNYNRADDEQVSYRLERPDDPANELRLWEAARATSAAPTFFRPFVNSRTNQGYIDGAVFHNNPVRIANYESKLIWPDVEESHPDILLSIGTGHNGADTEGFVDTSRSDRRRFHTRAVLRKRTWPEDRQPQRSHPALWAFPEVNSWVNVLFKRVDNLLDSEAIWRSFRSDVVGSSSPMQAQRYTRLNPQVKFRVPKMDDKSQIDKLYDDVSSRMQNSYMHTRVVGIAYRLVASCFYFEKFGPLREVDDHYQVTGTIRCRFSKGSENLRSLGLYLQRHQLRSFQPYFRVQEAKHSERVEQIVLTREIIRTMTETSYFDIGTIVIPVAQQTSTIAIDLHLTNDKKRPHPFNGFPISGFPRSLANGEPLKRTPASSPTPSEPERPSMAQKRESLRRKRSVRPGFPSGSIDTRPISTVSNNGSSSSDTIEYPENANEVNDWVRRRFEARRASPRPVQQHDQGVFELYGSPVGEPRMGLDMEVGEDDEDVALLQALERSQMEQQDDYELQKIIELSLVDM